jgi:hypothetical protein
MMYGQEALLTEKERKTSLYQASLRTPGSDGYVMTVPRRTMTEARADCEFLIEDYAQMHGLQYEEPDSDDREAFMDTFHKHNGGWNQTEVTIWTGWMLDEGLSE